MNQAFDHEAERAVIGSIILKPAVLDDVTPILGLSDFHDPANHTIYDALVLMQEAGEPIDTKLLAVHLRQAGTFRQIGGAVTIAATLKDVAIADNAAHYAKIVVRKAMQRRIIRITSEAGDAAAADSDPAINVETLRTKLDHITKDTAEGDTVTLHDAAKQRLELITNPESSNLGPLIGSGIDCIDDSYGGFRCGGSYVIAARPGRGKSALAKQICNSLDKRKHPTLIVSLEMEPHEIATRILSERTGIDGKYFEVDESGQCAITDDELADVRREVELSEHSVIRIKAPRGSQATIEGIAAAARIAKAKHGIKLLAIDYLQIVNKSHPRQSDYEHATGCSKACKVLARELGIVVLVLSQLNRDSEKSQTIPRRPRLSDLRDSGSIEQDADGVIFIHQRDESSNDYELIVEKWRNDARGTFDVRLVGMLTKFTPRPMARHENFSHDVSGANV